MKPGQKEEGLRWLKQAEQDLSDGLYNMNGDRHHLACFLAQQAAEKALKGYLYARGVEQPWGHSAADLCAAAADFDGDFAQMKPEAAALDRYYIPTRYPNGLPGGVPAEAFGADDSRRTLASADRIVKFAAERVEALP